MRSDLEDRVGTTVGGCWLIEGVLGVGGMAIVYAARHVSGRRAAFKIMRREHAGNAELRTRFLAEAEHLRRISHPDRVEILGFGTTDDGAALLMMELLEGETLASLWKRRRTLAVDQALSIAERVLDILHACHAAFVVHRDLKPENIFLTVDGRVKLIDFGVARSQHRSITSRRMAVGTPGFMSPEQAHGENSRVDARSDLFALGAVLWSLLSGKSFRVGRDDDDTLAMARRESARSLGLVAPDVPRAVIEIVDRALEEKPSARFQSARQMRQAILEILPTLEVTALRTLPPSPSEDRPTQPSTPSSLRALEDAPALDSLE